MAPMWIRSLDIQESSRRLTEPHWREIEKVTSGAEYSSMQVSGTKQWRDLKKAHPVAPPPGGQKFSSISCSFYS